MSKKVILIVMGIIFFSSYHLAQAGLVINEIMYDLSGADSTNSKSREWIEIYNNGSSDINIDASVWRIYDGGANRTINGEVNFSVPGGAYIIFAGDKDTFLIDHPGFFGIVYDTGITSLSNTGATLKILDQNGAVADSFTYASSMGGAGDGNSLQLLSGAWSGAIPTPGVANQIISNNTSNPASNPDPGPSSLGTGGVVSSSIVLKKEEPKIQVKITTESTLAFVGVPFPLSGKALDTGGEQRLYGKYFWNFGDGNSKEVKASDTEKFTHIYLYPGEYNMSLGYYSNPYSEIPDALARIIVKVVPMAVSISKVGDEKDFFIALSNNSIYEADISKWMLTSGEKSEKIFILPKNSVIMPNKVMMLSPSLTKFTAGDEKNLKLITSTGQVAYDYGLSLVPPPLVKPVPVKVLAIKNKDNNLTKVNTEPIISAVDLGAASILSDVAKETTATPYVWPAVFIVLLIASAGAVYFIRSRKTILEAGGDFKILDE